MTDGAQTFNLARCIDAPRLTQKLKQLNIDRQAAYDETVRDADTVVHEVELQVLVEQLESIGVDLR